MPDMVEMVKRTVVLVAMTAVLAGCAAPAEKQYYSAASYQGSEECRALQSVIEARERYGIVAPSDEADRDALRRCSSSPSGSAGPVLQTARPISSAEEVPVERFGKTYRVPVRINETITLPFILDTGATELVIPADVVLTLIRAGAVNSGDFIGKGRYSLANGSEEVSDRVIIREVQVGQHTVSNVTAIVNPPASDLLLGQSFLSKFGKVTLDYKRLVLVLSPLILQQQLVNREGACPAQSLIARWCVGARVEATGGVFQVREDELVPRDGAAPHRTPVSAGTPMERRVA